MRGPDVLDRLERLLGKPISGRDEYSVAPVHLGQVKLLRQLLFVEHVADRPPHLRQRLQFPRKVVVGEDAPRAFRDAVHCPRDAHRQTLHPARERDLVHRLDDEVEVVALHREVDQPEAGPCAARVQGRRTERNTCPRRSPGASGRVRMTTCSGKRCVCSGRRLWETRRSGARRLRPAPARLPPQSGQLNAGRGPARRPQCFGSSGAPSSSGSSLPGR